MASTNNRTPVPGSDTPVNGFFVGAVEALKTVYDFGAVAQEKADALASEIKEINGIRFVWNQLSRRWEELHIPLPDDDPVPEAVKLFTLDGLVDYIKENVEGLIPTDGEKLLLQVYDETRVVLLGKPLPIRKTRYAIALCEAHAPKQVYGQYMSVEEFSTMLLSKFVPTDERDELFKVVK